MQSRAAVTTVEIMIAVFVLVIALVPTIGMFTASRESAHMSEHSIYAELLVARACEELAARPYGHLVKQPASWGDVLNAKLKSFDAGLPGIADFKEYVHNAWRGADPIRSKVTTAKVEDGLMSIRVSTAWGDVRAVGVKQSTYHAVRLRAQRDYGLRSIDADGTDL